jgi:hypothetical protein
MKICEILLEQSKKALKCEEEEGEEEEDFDDEDGMGLLKYREFAWDVYITYD